MGDKGAAPAFRVGDRVQFWDGGPLMHVVSASLDLCHCQWVDEFGAIQQGTFEQRILTHAPASDSLPPAPN